MVILIYMATQATYDDANLILRLYELRREETMRKARQWFGTMSISSVEEMQKIAPQGSQENAYLRMVTSYWDMAAGFVTSGVLNQDLFLQTSGEILFVWEKVRDLVPAFRAMMKNPNVMKNLETVGNAAIENMPKEAYEAFQGMVRGSAAASSAAR